ncbi:MAG TPA: hypothetical protein VJ203_10890 [Bacteroidales bacterium]|nr:hypothetical protein [Bacteroidales bacterium]
MPFHLIRIIAGYEMRTLLRSWFFRIFAGMSVFGLGIFNIAMNVKSSGAPWMYRALAASIPYANLIVLNLGQAVIAVFLASEFLKQDRKNDTVEVIYARSMTNGQYILGKTLGILAVFLVLNIIVLLLGIGFSFLSNANAQSVFAYFTYPLLISLPTLVFILGLSLFIMVLIKNQAVTFILLTGYIALTIFYLNKKAYHIFDYIAYQVPMMYSSISGFADFKEILLHRSIYFLLGVGFILLAVYKLQRLPQSPRYASLPLYLGLFFLLSGGFLIYRYLDMQGAAHTYRQKVLALNNRYVRYDRVTVSNCMLDLRHEGKEIAADALLTVHNRNKHPVDTMIFSLNPGLLLQHVLINSKAQIFRRNMQIIEVIPAEPIIPGDSLEITFRYRGRINENIAFLDKDPVSFEANTKFEVFTLRKRYAFLQGDFVCLTGEVLWYPVSGTGYATEIPFRHDPDYVRFKLKVSTTPLLTALSQGQAFSSGKGNFEFLPEYPLPEISLLIGDYTKSSVKVDSIEYSLYAIKGHEYFKDAFDLITDTIPSLIRGLKKDYEANLGMQYPFRRLMMAEVPVHYAVESHVYSFASDAVQPELILSPEKGVLFNDSDFEQRRVRMEKDLKNNHEEVLPEELQSRLFNQFFRDNFLAKRGQYYNYGNVVNWSTFSVFPEYFSYRSRLHSDKWPVLTSAMEMYMYERNNTGAATLPWYQDLSMSDKINLELRRASLEELLKTGIESDEDSREPITVRDLAQAKGLHFFNVLRAKFGEAAVDTLVSRLVADHPHRKILFDELNSRFQERFGVNLEPEIQNWYVQEHLPGFVIRNISSYKVSTGEVSRYQIRFDLSNPENTDGIVTLNVEFNDPNRNNGQNGGDDFKVDFTKKILLQAKSSVTAGYAFNTEPARMSIMTHISQNLPNNLIYSFQGFTETRKTALLDEIVSIPFFENASDSMEIIVDNEDAGFSLQQATNKAYLKSLVNRNRSDRYKYSAIWAWNPPREWKPVLRSGFNGNYVHSAHYTRGGTGERIAGWKAVLHEKATYDVYFYFNKVNLGWRRTNKSPDYNFIVYHDGGADRINRSSEDADEGWNYLGSFYISSDTAAVELTNKTIGDMVFADAVKWVRSDE